MKEGEDAKRKTYRALCVISKEFSIDWVKEKLEAITDLELAQHTPIRVLHRRADAKRLRTVYYMKVESPPMTSLPEGTVYILEQYSHLSYKREFKLTDFEKKIHPPLLLIS